MSGLIDGLCERFSGDYQRMAVALDQALAEIDRLRLEVANLRSENRELRRMLQDHELRMLRRAERDALLLGALHFAGGYTWRQLASVKIVGVWRGCFCASAACCARMAATRYKHLANGKRRLRLVCVSLRLKVATC